MFKLGLFVTFNSLLPFGDVLSDAFTVKDLRDNGHDQWADATFYFMWNPFILHLLNFGYNFVQAWLHDNLSFDWWAELKDGFIHLPFMVPFKNVYNAHRLFQIGFGTDQMDEESWEKAEKIQYEAGLLGMQESFSEAGPQAIVQLVIVFSTGHISYAQMVSIPMSILSLAWASSRAFFIMRTAQESDPDPNVKLIILRILPWELLIVQNRIILWTMLCGLLGKYVFIGVFLSFCIIFTALYLKQKRDARKPDTTESNPPEEQGNEEDFKAVTSLTALWLPSRAA